ncbi:MAG TPA: TIGR04063 family PEP-CTERM/XrtA system glycosyltransferase [Candidatus Methylomirabilis sp.]|nr:TIGR04063 family PEP-CTERM/XrtA system glycosyltransferase [Candidatus Methylomirabilis sp.]
MRVLHVLDHSLPLQSGYVFRTLGILSAQQGFGWATIQLTSPRYHSGETALERVDGWEFHRTPTRASRSPLIREVQEMRATERKLQELIAQYQPDILHSHSPVLNGIPALRAARRAKLPLIYEVRAFWEDAAVDLGRTRVNSLRYRAIRQLETYVLQRADGVVTLCEGMRKEIARRGIPDQRIAVVPNAVEPTHFGRVQERDQSLAKSLELSDRTVLGFIGSFYHYEGLDLLLSALPQIRAARPDTVLLLVGGGPEEAKLRSKISQENLAEAVRFVGRVPHGEVRRYYDLVDYFVYPRRRIRLTELVTPLKPLEAMAEGRIVLASDVGGHRELIRDSETGFLFAPDDPASIAHRVIEVLSKKDEHSRIRDAARDYVATERTWPVCASSYRELYDLALRKRVNATRSKATS